MLDFAAFDVETANEQPSSICSIGLVIVRQQQITERFYSLVQPEPNYYNYWNSRIHGLTRQDTEEAPVFSQVWAQLHPLIEGLPLVAHNKGFDQACLRAAFQTYQMDYPDYVFYCTLQASRKHLKHLGNHKLHTVAAHCGYDLQQHHHALADAEACAHIALYLKM